MCIVALKASKREIGQHPWRNKRRIWPKHISGSVHDVGINTPDTTICSTREYSSQVKFNNYNIIYYSDNQERDTTPIFIVCRIIQDLYKSCLQIQDVYTYIYGQQYWITHVAESYDKGGSTVASCKSSRIKDMGHGLKYARGVCLSHNKKIARKNGTRTKRWAILINSQYVGFSWACMRSIRGRTSPVNHASTLPSVHRPYLFNK
jgi:hypothetical protein